MAGEYLTDFRDVQFILYEQLGIEKLCQYERNQEFSKEVFDMVWIRASSSPRKCLPR